LLPIDISVVIPTFRRPGPLAEAIESALTQEDARVEVLVVDDSPEGSARVVAQRVRDPRVTYLQQAPPSGGRPGVARNLGWSRARGEHVHFLDDDDRVAPGGYRALLGALHSHPDRGVAFGTVEPFGKDRRVLARQRRYFRDAARRARIASRIGRRTVVANMLFRPTLLVNSACLIRRSCLQTLGGYDPAVNLVEDVDFYARAIRRFDCVFVDRRVLLYRTGASSIMHDLVDGQAVVEAYTRIYRNYRMSFGWLELMGLRLFARTAMRLL
jgi:glycosyltransferase involved in cell wall biosynthesis